MLILMNLDIVVKVLNLMHAHNFYCHVMNQLKYCYFQCGYSILVIERNRYLIFCKKQRID